MRGSTRDPDYANRNCLPVKLSATGSNGNGLARHFAPRMEAAPQQFEASSDSPGLILLDTFLRPLYVNDEAVSILSYPQSPNGNGHLAHFMAQKIDSIVPKKNGSPSPKYSGKLASGRRHYQVRVFALKSNLANGSVATLAILLERKRESRDPLQVAKKFRLTQRETEALELLMQGYTTKQIASRMEISPNTAKAFLRSVMSKSGASDRTGILAKVLQL